MSRESPDAETADAPVVESALAGVVAWLAGYFVTYALTSARIETSFLNRVAGALSGEATAWRIVGWVFYNAHFASTTIDAGVFGSSVVNVIEEAGFSPLLYAIPPVLLFVAGFAMTRLRSVPFHRRAVALASAPLFGGYLLLTLVGLVVFPVAAAGGSSGPDPASSLVLVGVLYPLAFGGGGVALGARSAVAESRPDQERAQEDQ